MAARKRATARAAVLPARRRASPLGRIAPSGRSIALGVVLFAVAVGAYAVARETSVLTSSHLVSIAGRPGGFSA